VMAQQRAEHRHSQRAAKLPTGVEHAGRHPGAMSRDGFQQQRRGRGTWRARCTHRC
jgi:hypothetical protein